MRTVNKNPSVDELKSFGRVMLGGFALIGALLWYSSIKTPGAWWPTGGWAWNGSTKQSIALLFWGVAPCIWAIATWSPRLARPIYVGWMTGSGYMGKVSSFVLLSLLFFIALPVFSLIRLGDPLRLILGRSDSYWETPTEHEATLERMAKPF